MSTSSKKMKVSKTHATSFQGKNLNNSYYQDRLAEQREARQNLQSQLQAEKSKLGENRNASCTSHNQKITNPSKNYTYISGKPKANIGTHSYEKNSSSQGIATEGSANHYGGQAAPQRSVLSIKNAAHVIKRKNNYQQNGQGADLKVNIKQNSFQKSTLPSNTHVVPQNMAKGKNIPNGLLRRATDGAKGK